MFNIDYDWKVDNQGNVWKVHLPTLEAWMRANAGSDYAGNSADSALHLWFNNEPNQTIKDAVQAHWDSLDEATEAALFDTDRKRALAVAAAQAAIPGEDWNSMIAAERKIVMNQALSDADKDALLVKYPQT